ncbi:MAG: tetratricopeptide repeat protein [Paramuribaculum sp.]|nr:tetratricopeptide repeat protein [Paramuribaculum sp.]
MKKQLCYSLVMGGVLVLTGCNKKLNQFDASYFNTNPNPLELVGENVPAVVTGNVPAKFFVKNAEVTVTPVLVYGGTETASSSFTFQGEKVRGNNPVISYEQGGRVSVPVNFVYQPEMIKSELYLNFDVKQGNKQYVLPRVKVADGVVATGDLASAAGVTPALAPDAFQRIINEKYSADIRFLINMANIRKDQLTSDAMELFNENVRKAAADTTRVIEELNISSYASPDGTMAFNTQLAENREKNTQKYLEGQLKKDKITEFGELTSQFTPEDWEGFKQLVSASNIQDKDLILSVLAMYKDPEVREREIRNLSSVFEVLADEILPQLRYSRLTASVNVIGKSPEQINWYIDNKPGELTIEELLYGATLTNDANRKKNIYTLATKQYPNDYRGFNDLGMVYYEAGDYTSALNNFKKAAQLNPRAAEPQMNQGLVAMLGGDYKTANSAFGNAAGLNELGDALGVYYLKQGDAAGAVKAFGNSKSNNAAVAQILTKDYAKAKATLNGVATPDANTYYLLAVVGARTNDAQTVSNNLAKAIKLDNSLATRAANDLEFANYNLSNVIK